MGWGVIGRIAVAAGLAATVLTVVGGQSVESDGRPWLAALERVVPIALAAGAGLLVIVPRAALAGAATLTALAASAYLFVGRPGDTEGPSMLAASLVVPLLFLLIVMLVPAASPRSSWVLAWIAVVALAGIVRALVYEPFADRDCVGLCRHNPILVTTDLELAHGLGMLGAAAVVVLAAALVWQVIRTDLRDRPRGAHDRVTRWCAGVAAVALGVDNAVRLASDDVSVPGHVTAEDVAVTLAAAAIVSIGLITTALDPLRARRDVGRVVLLLERAGQESDVQTIFQNATGDTDLLVGYWMDGTGFLDRDGEPVPQSGRPHVELTSRGSPMALIVPGTAAVWPELVAQQLGAHARLAIHNESLTFELNRRVEEVARSRRRIVEVGDAERQRLERDLHDGAQQRLLALSFELRRGERVALAANDERSAATFISAYELAQTALEQVRDLAHGIHPATLGGAGLREAVTEYADSSGHNVDIDVEIAESLSDPIAATTYRIITAGIAASANGTTPHVLVRRDGRTIAIAIDGLAELPQHAVDRAAAIGGTCTPTNTGVEVALPCGS